MRRCAVREREGTSETALLLRRGGLLQAVLALVRRRVNALWVLLSDRRCHTVTAQSWYSSRSS